MVKFGSAGIVVESTGPISTDAADAEKKKHFSAARSKIRSSSRRPEERMKDVTNRGSGVNDSSYGMFHRPSTNIILNAKNHPALPLFGGLCG